MKKILSIAAVSVFSTAILSIGANATNNCTYSFESYAARLKESGNCRYTVQLSTACKYSGTSYCDDEIIKELLKDCEIKYTDWSECFPNYGGNPEESPDEGNNGSGSPNKPVIPDKENEENNSSGSVDNNFQQNTTISTTAQQVIDLVNKERKANGLSPVSASNAALNSAAAKRAQEQATLFSHTRPDGRNWSTVLSDYGIKYRNAGENVAYGQRSAQEVMNAWMNSSGHRANILNENYTTISVGVYYNNGTYYWSQLFIG